MSLVVRSRLLSEGYLIVAQTRLIGHFGAFLLFPGFRFQPISRFLVLPGAWARFSPCRDRLASALPVLSDCRRRLLCSQQSCFGVTSFFLFCPLLSGAAFSGRRAVDLRSTHVAVSVTGFEPFPCSSTCLSRQCSGPGRSHALLSERNEALLPIGDRGKAAPGAVAVPRGDRGPTSPTIRAAYPVPTRGHCKCPAGRLKLCLD